jgi:ABC transporter substrate binding protein
MASGHLNRTSRPNTWQHRPSQRREDFSCHPEPSTHGTFIGRRSAAGSLTYLLQPLSCHLMSSGLAMKRREFVRLVGGAAVAWPVVARAQQRKNIPRLCFLTFDPGTLQSTRFDAFFQALRDLGYVDGQTIAVEYLSADGRSERLPALADECLRLKADIIALSTTPAALAAKNATRTVPIVMIALGDPVGTGLVNSLARPGGNVTGMSLMVPELAVKRLELLKEACPASRGCSC